MRILLVLSAFGLALAGCQSVSTEAPTVPFSAEEAAFIKKTGTGVITGHAFRTRERGVVVHAAGEVVRLVPATAYAKERYARLFGSRKYLPLISYPSVDKVDPAYVDYTRSTKTESTGRFAFENVAPGTYFVTTLVSWQEPDRLFREGGTVYDVVTVTGQEKGPVHVVLSGN